MEIQLEEFDFTPSIAGIWIPVDDVYYDNGYDGSVISFTGNVKLGENQRLGMVAIGWSYSGFDNDAKDVIPVNLAILEQQEDGTLFLATDKYVTDQSTNGGGSVLSADFNGDGYQDIFLAAHNESPQISKESTALISNEDGTFAKFAVDNPVQAHGAAIFYVNDEPYAFTSSFSADWPEDRYHSPIFFWNGSDFDSFDRLGSIWPDRQDHVPGSTEVLADFNNDGIYESAFGDVTFGPGLPWDESNKPLIAIFEYTSEDLLTPFSNEDPPVAVIEPYFDNSEEFGDFQSADGDASHTYRLWVDDFNHDGLVDIVAGVSRWTQEEENYPNVIQLIQNTGDFNFIDVTDGLNPDYNQLTEEIGYQPYIADLDESGIESYSVGNPSDNPERQSNYLLLNDGTGRLHVALHETFLDLAVEIDVFVRNHFSDKENYFFNDEFIPGFRGYLTEEGKLNFVAQIHFSERSDEGVWMERILFVNVPTEIDITTDFKKPITIEDRNGSQLIRTFAGDDIIYDRGAAEIARIDGGIGEDILVYSLLPSQYQYEDGIIHGPQSQDSVVNIERAGFGYGFGDAYRVDVSIDDLIDSDGDGPELSAVALLLNELSDLYIAYFNRAPDAPGLTYWFKEIYTGSLTFDLAAKSFSDQVEYQETYPAGSTNSDFINSIYQNLFNRAPDQAGKDYWEGELNGGMPRDTFILAVINGAYAPTGGEEDRALLINKHDVSVYYAEQSMLDPDEGFDNSVIEVLNAVTSDDATVDIAKDVIDYAFENDPLTLTGIVEDQALWELFWGA